MSSTRAETYVCENCGTSKVLPILDGCHHTGLPSGWWRIDALREGYSHVIGELCSAKCAGFWLETESKKAGSTHD